MAAFHEVDWRRWLNTPEAEAWKCVAVTVGIDPDRLTLGEIEKFAKLSDRDVFHDRNARDWRPVAREFSRRLKIVCANIQEILGLDHQPLYPELETIGVIQCAHWLRDRRFYPVAELADAPSLQAVKDGASTPDSSDGENGMSLRETEERTLAERRMDALRELLKDVPEQERLQLKGWTREKIYEALREHPDFHGLSRASFDKHVWGNQKIFKLPNPAQRRSSQGATQIGLKRNRRGT